ncbi:disks large-associated protein 5 [Aplochiton taeniatus]
MESRFAHLRQRDNSVDMLRVKMSRRRSQSQKENRDRAVNTRRQLAQLPEMECSTLEASLIMANKSTVQEMAPNIAKQATREERMKMLARFKEKKALQKEKEKREKEKKGVFKVGLYRPRDASATLPEATTGTAQNSRVTRSMKQAPKVPIPQMARQVEPAVARSTRSRTAVAASAPAAIRNRVAIVEPTPRAFSTRSANRPPAGAVPVSKEKPSADARVNRTRATQTQVTAPSKGSGRNTNAFAVFSLQVKAQSKRPFRRSPKRRSRSQRHSTALPAQPPQQETEAPPTGPLSFAPDGFTFQAPAGLSFKLTPMTPRSAEAFLTPRSLSLLPSFNLPAVPLLSAHPEAKSELSALSTPGSTLRSAAPPSPVRAAPAQPIPLEPQHDIPYFRSEMVCETSKLTGLCHLWEPRVEDETIPEEMRDCMRTAVGQARLLMKERFGQFGGLVDDCELGRGEKITTCSDLQGFWDMVYYQVEDVYKKFGALKELESNGWVEEQKRAPPRQKKLVKKPPPAAVSKPSGTNAAAKSRLAAIKAAMKAKQEAAEAEKRSAQAAGDGAGEDTQPEPQAEGGGQPEPQAEGEAPAPRPENVVFQGGFFQVESPAKLPGSMRKSSRLHAAALPRPSPSSLAKVTTPGRARRSVAAHHASSGLRLSVIPGAPAPGPRSPPRAPHQPPRSGTPPRFSAGAEASQSERAAAPDPAVGEEPAGAQPTLPALSSPPAVQLAPAESDCDLEESMAATPDTSFTEGVPGLDFERYLQPSARCSLSPRETVAPETSSPMVTDVEMDSPLAQPGVLLTEEEVLMTPSASHRVPHVFSSLTPQPTALSDLLLFTPDPKDRIRQSVCPSDLMVFTPPSHR